VIFIRMKNTVGAQSAQWPLGDLGRYLEMFAPHWRGRRPVRADRRFCTDDEPVRTKSAILDKPLA
jgi:hypothetical protein